jgi:hypothetical protein
MSGAASSRSRLIAALAAALVTSPAPELELVHRWLELLDRRRSVRRRTPKAGVWDLQLTAYGDGHWRATFWVTGQAHSIVGGSAWEAAPWTAVQRAAWATLQKAA